MTRNEFIETLQKTLAGSMGSGAVGENVRYYEEYIDTQVRTGQSEREVIEELGDPRLLAKTIIEAGKYEGRDSGQDYKEVYEEGREGHGKSDAGSRVYHMPGWLLALCVVFVFVIVIGIVGSVLSALLPILIPIVCVLFLVRMFKHR